jgi:hypothetical protein
MDQQVYVLLGLGLLVGMRILATHPRVQRWGRELLRQIGARVVDWVNQPPEVDELADELWRAHRRERLRADVWRLERLLATDMAMSATRQLGNRLAHDWLVRELEADSRDLPPSFASDDFDNGWSVPGLPTRTRNIGGGRYSQSAQVEFLDIGWKR